jgi:cytochrome c
MTISASSRRYLLSVVIALSIGPQARALADTGMAAANAAAAARDSARAEALLERAVAHYEADKEEALVDFRPKGPYVDRELYVYALTTDGVGLASGGSSSSLVGENLLNRQDAMGDYFFRNLVDRARSGDSGTVEYQWLNAVDNRVERKIAHFRRIGNTIIVVGHYVPRATPAQAQALLGRAVTALRADRKAALQSFNERRGRYFEDDLYVFVIDLKDRQTLAHGADPSLVGTDATQLVDVNESSFGHPLVDRMIAALADRDRAEVDYAWSNPVTNLGEHKHAYLCKVNQMIVGVGYYAP